MGIDDDGAIERVLRALPVALAHLDERRAEERLARHVPLRVRPVERGEEGVGALLVPAGLHLERGLEARVVGQVVVGELRLERAPFVQSLGDALGRDERLSLGIQRRREGGLAAAAGGCLGPGIVYRSDARAGLAVKLGGDLSAQGPGGAREVGLGELPHLVELPPRLLGVSAIEPSLRAADLLRERQVVLGRAAQGAHHRDGVRADAGRVHRAALGELGRIGDHPRRQGEGFLRHRPPFGGIDPG